MCGIYGYTGKKEAQGVILEGLKHLEYRGYDSSGLAVQNGLNALAVEKTSGKIRNLEQILKSHPLKGSTAIGHTRWATHGVPSRENAHPHLDKDDRIAVVHNGIIENYFDLKQALQEQGVVFRSQTDTEVITHLIAKYYKGNLESAVQRALKDLKGTYAIAVMCSKEPGKIVSVMRDSYKIIDGSNKIVRRAPAKIQWDITQAQKGGFPHFMLKEIFEQPGIVAALLHERVTNGQIHFDELKITPAEFKNIKRIVIIACGTAYHAGLTTKSVFDALTDI